MHSAPVHGRRALAWRSRSRSFRPRGFLESDEAGAAAGAGAGSGSAATSGGVYTSASMKKPPPSSKASETCMARTTDHMQLSYDIRMFVIQIVQR